MIDTETPGSPGWWFKALACKLQDRRCGRWGGLKYTRRTLLPQRVRPGLDMLDDYHRGDPPLVGCAPAWQPYFFEVVRMARLNVAALIVEAKAERMQLRDFRTAAANDELGDEQARRVMRANKMKLLSRDVHDMMLAFGDAYTITTPGPSPDVMPTVTAEDPREVITAHDPATGQTLAALKMFRDEWDAADFAYVYLPGKVYKATKPKGPSAVGSTAPFRMSSVWTWDGDVQSVPGGRMPVVRFHNRFGVGEFEQHLDTLDRINDQILNRLVIAKVQAFRQRAVRGLKTTDDDTGEEIDYSNVFEAAPGSLWQVDDDVEFWESTPVDIGPLRLAIKDDLENLAAVTSTPLNTITPDAAEQSAEGASLQREQNTFAVEDREDRAGPGWAETMSLNFEFMGDETRADVTQIEPMWAPIERYSLIEKSGAAAQLKGLLPAEAIFTDILQYPPAEIPNLRLLRGADLFFEPPATSGAPNAPAIEHLVPGPSPDTGTSL